MRESEEHILWHKVLGASAFLIAFVTYLVMMQPSLSFWDCGEFAAAAWGVQIPHPPGAPLWTLVGRIAMIVPILHDPIARYNLLSVLASSVTVLLLYLTLVRIIKLFKSPQNNFVPRQNPGRFEFRYEENSASEKRLQSFFLLGSSFFL